MTEYFAIYCRGDERGEYHFEARTVQEALQHARRKYEQERADLCFSANDRRDAPLDRIVLQDWDGNTVATWEPYRA
jgi:hypothetical protein